LKLYTKIIVNGLLSKFCSLLCYRKFGPLYKFLCSTFGVRKDLLFQFSCLELWQVFISILMF
jgi:hypothetical protein